MENVKKVFFIGINGIGMSGLAKIAKSMGLEVEGSDIARKNITKELEDLGIKVYIEQKKENIKDIDMIVYSSAIKEDNPEYIEAKKRDIKMIKRGEFLAKLFNEKIGVAIAGTHGKTTTTSLMSSISMSKSPTIMVGGILPEINSNAKIGNSDIFIAEADESDNSFLYLKPKYSIITNIEEDHLENHGSFENIENSFKNFIEQTEDEVILCIDCENAKNLSKYSNKIKTYSIVDKEADIYATNIIKTEEFTTFDLFVENKYIANFKIKIPGLHNVSNAIGAIYLALKFGVEIEEIKQKLESFTNARRRFDILYSNGITIVDDYAHHPTEIKATLKAAKERRKDKIVAVFQPHRFSRLKFLLDKFIGVFDLADEVIILPIYSAGEKNIYGVDEKVLAEKIKHSKINIMKSEEEILNKINENKISTTYLFMGAGDISQIAHNLSKKISQNYGV
ncbi:MAG: UDP-N-acetylmuramate--alanine ligase [Fusobacteriaceae bacterium]|jgi:UDP-N-acetylmuramate--alanine ligase|nr:UDP-N-acetylmuramate--L-alanine ligase [Fusobacteriales bacterium]MDN5303867.1 UDP-N-acetylmuramate--alanine ligase [Fusobacteriaceae bacterium]